ncbi:MAG: YggU family protein [Desulfuromonadales bacterium]|nr:MAG: YggU family protein [Desulfuromonadales bacterium]
MINETALSGLKITERADGVIFSVHVQPRSSKNEISGIQGEEIRLRLTSPPVEGEANRLCIEFLAKLLKVPKSAVTIVNGDKSRHKTVRIAGATAQDVLALFATCR